MQKPLATCGLLMVALVCLKVDQEGKSMQPLHAPVCLCLHLSSWLNGNVSQIKLNTKKP